MLISVTIPVYNDNNGLRLTLNSLLNQTYDNWEALVVDDGSLVSAEAVIAEFNDDRIKFYRFFKNKGRPEARQKTFEMMRGDLCAFLDAGDYYDKEYLSQVIEKFHNTNVIAVSQSMTIKYKGKNYISNYVEGVYDISSKMYDSISFASTIFISKICKSYIFNTELKYSQDKHFLNYIAQNNDGNIILLNSHAYIYDQGSNMSVKTTWRKYYYAMKRLFNQRKYSASIITFIKGAGLTAVHIFFGYERLLALRYVRVESK